MSIGFCCDGANDVVASKMETPPSAQSQFRRELDFWEKTHRQTGRTTRQMEAAPQGAFYIWPWSNSLFYARKLAAKLKRKDLQIIPLAEFTPEMFRSRTITGCVIDHASMPHMTEKNHQAEAEARIYTAAATNPTLFWLDNDTLHDIPADEIAAELQAIHDEENTAQATAAPAAHASPPSPAAAASRDTPAPHAE